jgi:hypothetical protein
MEVFVVGHHLDERHVLFCHASLWAAASAGAERVENARPGRNYGTSQQEAACFSSSSSSSHQLIKRITGQRKIGTFVIIGDQERPGQARRRATCMSHADGRPLVMTQTPEYEYDSPHAGCLQEQDAARAT